MILFWRIIAAYVDVISDSAGRIADHQFCEKCGLGPADDILHKALERKKKSGGKKKKANPAAMSDEEMAEDLGGWLECGRCVVAVHWVSDHHMIMTDSCRDVLRRGKRKMSSLDCKLKKDLWSLVVPGSNMSA